MGDAVAQVPPEDPYAEPSAEPQKADVVGDAERAVLGAVLLSNGASIWDVATSLGAGDFFDPRHQKIFQAMYDLAVHRKGVDQVSLTARLQDTGEINSIGGISYLYGLTDATPTAANVSFYVQIVRDASRRRAVKRLGAELINADPGIDLTALLDQARSGLDEVERTHTAQTRPMLSWADEFTSAMEQEPRFVPTPWRSINNLIQGVQPGELTVLAARPSSGKTMMGLQVADGMERRGPVAFASLEMSPIGLTQRYFAMKGRIHMSDLSRHQLTQDQWQAYSDVRHVLANSNLWVGDLIGADIAAVRAWVRSIAQKGPLSGIVVDYLQMLRGDPKLSTYENVSLASHELKRMAREFDCPLIALAQLNREPTKMPGKKVAQRPPMIGDLKGSGDIEQDADQIWLLQRRLEEDGQPGDKLDVWIAKNRNGRTGKKTLLWEGQFARVVEFPSTLHDIPHLMDGVAADDSPV